MMSSFEKDLDVIEQVTSAEVAVYAALDVFQKANILDSVLTAADDSLSRKEMIDKMILHVDTALNTAPKEEDTTTRSVVATAIIAAAICEHCTLGVFMLITDKIYDDLQYHIAQDLETFENARTAHLLSHATAEGHYEIRDHYMLRSLFWIIMFFIVGLLLSSKD
jgi:hypothetical protein